MDSAQLHQVITKMIDNLSTQIPAFKMSDDWINSEGNVAVCIIDEFGNVYGKIWGTNKIKGRRYYDIAYRKASQVWITGYATNEYERLVFSDKINPKDFGIDMPDLIGWQGGQPIQLDESTKIACGFSGFKGVNDLAVVKRAADYAMNKK